MIKKFFDIIPPAKIKERPAKTVSGAYPASKKKPSLRKKRSLSKILTLAIALLLFFTGLVLFLSFNSKATIVLMPYENPIEAEKMVSASSETGSFSLEKGIVEAKILKVEETDIDRFSSTGEKTKKGKAHGVLRIYNKVTPSRSIVFRANTRFLSSENSRMFICPQKIYIPGSYIKDKKVMPGTVDVEVEAVEPGESYNIAPSKFSIPGLAGTSLYYSVYAESKSPFSGGFTKKVKVVSEKDISGAKDILQKRLFTKAKEDLEKKAPDNFSLSEESILESSPQISCQQKIGDVSDSFFCQGSTTIQAMAFNSFQLNELAKNFILSKASPDKKINEKSISFHYDVHHMDIQHKKAELLLKVSAKTYKEIDRESFFSKIKGKSIGDVKKIIFENYPWIKSSKIKVFPFWSHIIPKDKNRIYVQIVLE